MIIHSLISVDELGPDAAQPVGQPSPPSAETAFASSMDETFPFEQIEKMYENRIKQILENIAGVNSVEVMVTIEATEEKIVYEKEKMMEQITDEKDRNGAHRHISDVSREGEIVLVETKGNATPVVLKTIRPQVSGVVVVAGGSENATVHRLIVEAVQKGLGVPQHKIAVIPGKQRR